MNDTDVEILLVEDNPNDAEMTIRSLKKGKIANNIIHLKDGAVALDFLFARGQFAERDKNDKPKVILLDIKMPKLSGIEVLRVIKADALTKKIPVVILTSSKEDPDIEECYQLGVNSYIVKPVEFDNFMKTIQDLGLYWLIHNQPPK